MVSDLHRPEVMEAALPQSFYYFIGVLVVMSASSIAGAVGLMIRMALWVGEYKAEQRTLRKDNDAAHAKIREQGEHIRILEKEVARLKESEKWNN